MAPVARNTVAYWKAKYHKAEHNRTVGFAMYYESVRELRETRENHANERFEDRERLEVIMRDTKRSCLPAHVKNMLVDLAEKANEPITCPVCLDDMDKDTFSMTPCGHALCIECCEKIVTMPNPKCPTCRSKLNNF